MKDTINVTMIENYRKENNLTKTSFCKLCKISVSTYNKILKGENFNATALFKIARVLNVHIHQLFC